MKKLEHRVKEKELEVIVYDKKDELDIKEAIITLNKQRDKTNEQKGREYVALLEIEKERAAKNQKKTQAQKGQQVGSSQVPQDSAASDESGKSREIAAKKVGLSHDTATKISKINKTIDECRKAGETELADKLLKTLNKKSVNSAYKQAEELIPDGTPAEIKGDTKTKPEFNKTTRPIDWAIWSWNPITGCRQGCKYCYAKDMANRFSDNKEFEPRFYEKRLDAPANTKFRDEYNSNIRFRSVFVCSMADLFGDGVEEEWIDKVMEKIKEKESREWNFLFLTKSPERMAQYMSRKGVPSNSWVGATVDKRFRIKPTIDAFSKIEAKVKYIYCEPLLEDLASEDSMSTLIKMVDWLLIGAQRRNIKNKVPEFQPKWDWVERLVNQAREAECPVYFKSNLTARPQEYPEYDSSLEARLANLKKKLPEEVFDSIKEEWDQRESNHNGGSEYIKNFQFCQFLEDKEKEFEEESNRDKKLTAKDNKTESEKKKLDAGKNKGNGNGTGEEEKTGSTEEPAQSPASVN